jgi:hypothetical protein
MARASAGKVGGTSRVRFVMMEAEIADGGDLSQFTQAMQNALRGPAINTVAKRIAAPPAQVNGDEVAEPDVVDEQVVETEETAEAAPRPRASRKPAPKPSVINIDTTSEPALSTLADPGSNHGRYLILARWFHDHRGVEAITADHVWTCYRHLGWPTDIPDFAQPLRELKHKQYFTTPERGKYAINQLGLAKAAEAASG